MAANEQPKNPKTQVEAERPRQLNLIGRESSELVIAFSGAIGSGLDQVIEQTRELVRSAGYRVEYVKLSNFIEKLGREVGFIAPTQVIAANTPDRYDTLQTTGNRLREKFSNQVLAKLAISKIAAFRTESIPAAIDPLQVAPAKVVFLIDQLKNPAEVELLRKVYGNLFYLVGVFASEEQRKRNLLALMSPQEAERAMDRDRREEEDHEQQLDKTLKLSDLFVRNTDENRTSTKRQIQRLLELIHGSATSTPSTEEYAMYAAYAAGLRSACMSRQVGAAITDDSGNILSTGCNDVPKSNGGLYTVGTEKDWRCYNWKGGECWNDHHKDRIRKDIATVLESADVAKTLGRPVNSAESDNIARLISSTTRLRDLLEFSRAVHAEMDAIVAVARKGGPSLVRGKLFTTTFPCHNCARHIVAAGITTVYYIEPYEKSLALTLHSDSIVGDPTDQDGESSKVRFLHFEGIAPRQYQRLFTPEFERKEKGKLRTWSYQDAKKSNPQYLDSYRQLETRVIEDLESRGISPEQLSKVVS